MTVGGTDGTGWDFFVSYTQADRAWAEWIAWQLEDAGHSVLIQAWDFVPGTNWIQRMHDGVSRCGRIIVVVSPAYIASVFGAAEWQSIWADDPTGAGRRVVPVRVVDCERPGLLTGIVGIDLFGISEPQALRRLQDAVAGTLAGRGKPLRPPVFPTPVGDHQGPDVSEPSDDPRRGQSAFAPPTPRPRFPGRAYHVDLRRARGVQIGDGNTQINRW